MTDHPPELDRRFVEALGEARRWARPEARFLRRLSPWHGLALLAVVAVSIAFCDAQTLAAAPATGSLQTLIQWTPFILRGFALNLAMSFFAMILATLLGVLLGLAHVSASGTARRGAWLVMQVFRNTPWLVILFAIILLVPYQVQIAGLVLFVPAWIKATIGLSLPVMANVSEIVRGAIRSIPDGQWEASESLAFTRRQMLWMVILPQCLKRMIPPWMNWYAILTLSTPIASILGVQEAVGNAQAAMESAGAHASFLIPFYGFILLLFFAYIYPIARWTLRLERKYAVRQ